MSLRLPELRALANKKVAVYGAGCLGATCILELARAGIGELGILDLDFVDPGTIGRWPLGMQAAGLPKVNALREFIESNYPRTTVSGFVHRIGAVRREDVGELPDLEVLNTINSEAWLILDATAELGVQHFLADTAASLGLPFVSVAGTHGGWGGKIIRIRPGKTSGCWMCAKWAFKDGSIPEPPGDDAGTVQAQGCGDVTFTGAGFDMSQVALSAVRAVVSTLCESIDGGYPEMPWDVTTISFRDESGQVIQPTFDTYPIEKHARCSNCTHLQNNDDVFGWPIKSCK